MGADHVGEDGIELVLGLLSDLSRENCSTIAGKAALNRGMPFDVYAYPVSGIPPFKEIGPEVEKQANSLKDGDVLAVK